MIRTIAPRATTAGLLLAGACWLALSVAPQQARAQAGVPNIPNPGKSGPVVQHAAPTLPTSARAAWPRLDAGAAFCRTRDDLRRLAQVVQARSEGTAFTGVTPDCRVIGAAVPIDIVTRESAGVTEVRLKSDPSNTGWTNTWLPTQPPR